MSGNQTEETTATTKSPPQFFTQVEMLDESLLNLNDWNANYVTKTMKATIEDDIEQNGFIGPIIIQRFNDRLGKNYVIINGEHRFKILKQMGTKAIPCTILDVDDERAKVLSIRLNREHGELLPDRLAKLLSELSPKKDLQFLYKNTGISFDELGVLTEMQFKETERFTDKHLMDKKEKEPNNKQDEDNGNGDGDGEETNDNTTVICPECGHKFPLY